MALNNETTNEQLNVTNEKVIIKRKKDELLSPKKDFVFQVLFGEVGSEEITKSFLEAILKEKITKVDLSKNPILRRMNPEGKMGTMDVLAIIEDEIRIDVEMQIAEEKDIIQRLLYYWGRTYIRGIQKAERYEELDKTIAILITAFEIKGLEELGYYTNWKIIEAGERKVILTEYMEIVIIELPKIYKEKRNKGDKLLEWLYFLENPKSEEVKKIMDENEGVKKAKEKLEEISQDEIMQRINDWKVMGEYREFTKEKRAREEGEKAGKKIGEKIGRKMGEEKKKKEIARKMKEKGIKNEEIEEITGLSKIEIEKL